MLIWIQQKTDIDANNTIINMNAGINTNMNTNIHIGTRQ